MFVCGLLCHLCAITFNKDRIVKRSKIIGIIGTVALHVAVLVFLFLYVLVLPAKQEEGGVPVMLGDNAMGQGDADPYTLTEVDLLPQPEASEPDVPVPEGGDEQPLITQTDEPSLQVKKEEPRQEQKRKEAVAVKEEKPAEHPKPKEKTEAEKRAEAERAAAQAASSKVAGAFGKGSKMGSTGKGEGKGNQGSPAGNGSEGKTSGVGASGVFDLNGRSLGPEGLPLPVYNVQDEGRVVVTIVVDPSGKVIGTQINKRTNTVNPALRRAAEEAARRARFNQVDGVNNQSGTITYYFKLK